MSDDRIMPCGCVVCVCEDEMQCHGCGAKACEAHDRIMNPLKYPSSPHALTREQCSLCTANRPRLCDQHYKQGADELLKHVTAAIQDQQTPGGVKATYEQLLELCNQQRHALTKQAQEIARQHQDFERATAKVMELRQLLAAMTAERDEALVVKNAQLADAQATIARLEDRIDLQCDEFQRISALTENDEVKGLCARAVKDIRQHVPVIQQRDTAEQQVARLRDIVRDLIDRVDVDNLTTQTVVRQAEEVLRGTDGQH